MVEAANEALPAGAERIPLHCECGDPACQVLVSMTHAEYEDVRASGSRFLVGLNHEDPETCCVVRESAGVAIIDVVAADARYVVQFRNHRHSWRSAEHGD